jgi:hypothetical protein
MMPQKGNFALQAEKLEGYIAYVNLELPLEMQLFNISHKIKFNGAKGNQCNYSHKLFTKMFRTFSQFPVVSAVYQLQLKPWLQKTQ